MQLELQLYPEQQTFKMTMSDLPPITSALPPGANIQNDDVRFAPDYVCLTPESGHSEGSRKTSAYDPKRTLYL